MEKSLMRFSFALATFTMIPVSAFAYIAPQNVFDPAQSTVNQTQNLVDASRLGGAVQAPPSLREGPDVITAQQARAAALREQAQAEGLQSIDAEPVDAYVAPDAPKPPSMLSNDTNYDIRMQRIAEQKSNGPTIVIAGAGVSVDSNGNILHSGAPLMTSTGPETTIAFVIMILAALSTFAFTFTKQRMTQNTGLSM